MQYSASYLDKFFNTITDYHSKVELLTIAYSKVKDNPLDWIVELGEIMSWQAQADRSGVWTYYEALDGKLAQTSIKNSKGSKDNKVLGKYVSGIGRYLDSAMMDEIDAWINANEQMIDEYVENILVTNKKWFYHTE